MADDDKIKTSDIIEDDGAIDKIVKQMGELNKQYETMVNAIRAGADRIVHSIKTTSGATDEGRKTIDEASQATSRLERAQKELKLAMSDTGKQIAWLKAQTADQNKATVEQQRYLRQAVTSYDKLKSDLKQTVETYKSLTAAERADSEMGEKLLNTILNLKNQIKALDNQMKPHIETLSEVEKAERKLAFLQSEEGQRLLELKRKIAEVVNAGKQEKTEKDALTKAIDKLNYARSYENDQLKELAYETREANRTAELQAIVNRNVEGSYNRLSAQYSLNKIELNKMSQAERESTAAGKQLEKETYEIYQQMIKMQEATGKHTLSVGNYKKHWDGLGVAMNQVIREIPAAAISINTFFLAISNNIPMLIDEINRLREANRAARAEGKATTSVVGSIFKSLFSLNSIMVILLTAFAMHGKEILNWIGRMLSGKDASLSMAEAMETLNEELSKSSGAYGRNITLMRRLTDEWKRLGDNAKDQQQWIKDNEASFRSLDVSINNVNDASKLFVDSTGDFIEALKARAKAEAALNILSKQYGELLELENKAEVERTKDYDFIDKTVNFFKAFARGFTAEGWSLSLETRLKDQRRRNIESINEDKAELQDSVDNYFKVYQFYTDKVNELYDKLGLDESHKKTKGRTPRDAEDTLESLSLAAAKAYQKSLTELEREEIKKRRKEYIDAYNIEVADLNKKYNKIQRILDGHDARYKKLTEEQKNQAIKAQEDIVNAIKNKQEEADYNLGMFGLEEQIKLGEVQLENLRLQAKVAKEGSEEELELKLKILKVEQDIAIAKNRQLPPSERQNESLIKSGFSKQARTAVADFGMTDFEQRQKLDEAEFNRTKHNEAEITRFKLEQEKERWEKQIRVAELGGSDWSQTQIDAAKATVEGINRELSEVNSFIARTGERGFGGALLESMGFNDDQINALGIATDTIIGYMQQIFDAEVKLAEQEVALAQKRVDTAKEIYEAEVEARSKGYANNVASAKRDLEQEKKRLREKERLAEDARKKQEAVNTVMQANSLVTASALIWSQLGFPWALPAIGAMWASFAAAKIKASQVTSRESSDEYGEGGIEFLEGGSHASGHDISLGVKNKRKRRMKAEGGEALAIINKHQTAKYRGILPDVIKSLNKGTFEDKYIKAFEGADKVNASLVRVQNNVDLTRLESDLSEIRRQNEAKSYILPDGTMIIEHKNLKRIIKN